MRAPLRDSGLTVAQETYAAFVALGYAQLEAYRLAYPNQAGSKATSLQVNASRLANDVNVVLFVRQLRTQILQSLIRPSIADLAERQTHATGIMRTADAAYSDQLRANRLLGEYARDLSSGVQIDARQLTVNADLTQFVELLRRLELSPAQRRTLDELLGAEERKALADGGSDAV